jgi:predicted dienelactone hydrolase
VRYRVVRPLPVLVLVPVLVVAALLGACGTALAAATADVSYPPDRHGPYGIGHASVILTDGSRNLDGSVPATTAGRLLYLHIWYPTTATPAGHVTYTWNNPLYSQNPGGAVYPGLPDLPALSFTGSTSASPVAEAAPLAKASFPLLVASHGNEVAAAKSMPDTLEILASHGYVVASVEHTGNDEAWYLAWFLEHYAGLPLGPNPALGADIILQRSKDVSFVIDAMLAGVVDRKTGIPFSDSVDADRIGVLGYSLGGETSLATVTGISAAGFPADRRVKAAFMGAGTNYGLLLGAADYANARVPLLFFGNDTGIAYSNFNAFAHSTPKYLVDIAGFNHHVAGYQSGWCQDIHNSMVAVNPAVFPQMFFNPSSLSRTDIVNYVFDATFYWSYTGPREAGVYDYCEPSVFDRISDAQLVAVLFGDARILGVRDELRGLMPLTPEVSIAELTRLGNWYAVSFFNSILKRDESYARYLAASERNERTNPLVKLVANCETVAAHPLDLAPGDRITFIPAGESAYEVSVSSGAALYDPGTNKLSVGGDGAVYLSYPGFAFPVPGLADPVSTIVVNEKGALTARTSPDIGFLDDNGSPWYMKGHLLLRNRFTIGALMKDLDSKAAGPGGGVFGYFDAANDRVIVTYKEVPARGTTQPNTLQIALYGSGRIEMTIGALAATGAIYSPGILGTIGVASGQTRASELRDVEPVRFASLRDHNPVLMPFGRDAAIFEQFYTGIAAECGDDR